MSRPSLRIIVAVAATDTPLSVRSPPPSALPMDTASVEEDVDEPGWTPFQWPLVQRKGIVTVRTGVKRQCAPAPVGAHPHPQKKQQPMRNLPPIDMRCHESI